MLRVYAHDVGYQETIINKAPCISCEHSNYQPTSSTAPPLPYKTLPATEPFHYTSGEPDARDPTNTLVDRSKVSDKGFGEERRMFFVLLKFGVFEHQGTKSSFRRTGENTDRDAPGGDSWYVKYHRSRKHQGECKHWHQSQRQEDAVQRSGGSQGGRPTKREL